jgi:hypothetical protein
VDTVKKEVEFFNNYIRDPRRPQLPEEKPPLLPAAKKQGGGVNSGDAPAASKKLRTEELLPEHPHVQRRSIHERLGTGGAPRKGEVRITHAQTDPRALIDYSDVDNFTFDIFG